jgi:hypothetical protein
MESYQTEENIIGNEVLDNDDIQILGGFFVYRAKPTNESKRIKELSNQTEGDFAQKGEITGMVLIKKSGNRKFMTYAPIDTTNYTVDKFMEYFKDTMKNNKYDDSVEKVFEIEALGTLVNKLIVQKVEEEPMPAPAATPAATPAGMPAGMPAGIMPAGIMPAGMPDDMLDAIMPDALVKNDNLTAMSAAESAVKNQKDSIINTVGQGLGVSGSVK